MRQEHRILPFTRGNKAADLTAENHSSSCQFRVLFLKCLIQSHLRNERADNVLAISDLDLLARVSQQENLATDQPPLTSKQLYGDSNACGMPLMANAVQPQPRRTQSARARCPVYTLPQPRPLRQELQLVDGVFPKPSCEFRKFGHHCLLHGDLHVHKHVVLQSLWCLIQVHFVAVGSSDNLQSRGDKPCAPLIAPWSSLKPSRGSAQFGR